MSGGGILRTHKRRRHTRKVSGQARCENGKVRYRDQRAANDALIVINQGEKHHVTPQRAYPCDCGGWHLTSWERDA